MHDVLDECERGQIAGYGCCEQENGKNWGEGLPGEGGRSSMQKNRKMTLKVSAGCKYLYIYKQ